MIIKLNMTSEIPIYVQLRNEIVLGIGRGELKAGEQLPTVRQMAADIGVNTMTVNKSYQILKAEGFIETDRRRGARVSETIPVNQVFKEKLEAELELLTETYSPDKLQRVERVLLEQKRKHSWLF